MREDDPELDKALDEEDETDKAGLVGLVLLAVGFVFLILKGAIALYEAVK